MSRRFAWLVENAALIGLGILGANGHYLMGLSMVLHAFVTLAIVMPQAHRFVTNALAVETFIGTALVLLTPLAILARLTWIPWVWVGVEIGILRLRLQIARK